MKLDPTPAADVREPELSSLQMSYTERVNMAVADDRYDLVAELAAAYEDELRQLEQPAA